MRERLEEANSLLERSERGKQRMAAEMGEALITQTPSPQGVKTRIWGGGGFRDG